MRNPTVPKLPFAHLVDGRNAHQISELLGTAAPRTVQRWLEVDGIPIHQADIFAIKVLGMHPILVWGEAWEVLA